MDLKSTFLASADGPCNQIGRVHAKYIGSNHNVVCFCTSSNLAILELFVDSGFAAAAAAVKVAVAGQSHC